MGIELQPVRGVMWAAPSNTMETVLPKCSRAGPLHQCAQDAGHKVTGNYLGAIRFHVCLAGILTSTGPVSPDLTHTIFLFCFVFVNFFIFWKRNVYSQLITMFYFKSK